MGDLDDASKGVLQVAPADVLRLALGPGVRRVRERNPVRVSNQRLRDGLFDAEVDGEPALVHIEVEATPRTRTPRRIEGYWHQLRFALRRPVHIAVVYLQRGGWSGRVPAGFWTRGPDGVRTRLGFHPVALWELDAAKAAEGGPLGVLPLVPFMRGSSPRLVARVLDRLRRARVPAEKKAELQVTTAMFAGRVFPAINWIGTLSEEERMASTTYDWIVERGLEQGREQGGVTALRRGIQVLVRELHGRAPRALTALLGSVDDIALLQTLLIAVARADSAEAAVAAVQQATARPRRRKARRSPPRRQRGRATKRG